MSGVLVPTSKELLSMFMLVGRREYRGGGELEGSALWGHCTWRGRYFGSRSGHDRRMSGPSLDHASSNSSALDRDSFANLAMRVTAKGMCPNTLSNLLTSRSFSESG